MANQFTNTATEIDWDSPVTKKHIKEAEAVGLTLIGVGRNHLYRSYSIDKCSHQFERRIDSVRNGIGIKCKICPKEKFKIDWDSPNTKKQIREAKAVGLELLGLATKKDINYRLYRFKDCGHEQEIQIAHVRINNFKCQTCPFKMDWNSKTNRQYAKDAELAGLELLGLAVENDTRWRLYRFKDCGHEQEIGTNLVRKNQKGSFTCNKCINLRLKDDAYNAGLELVGEGRNSDVRLFRFKDCGHEQEIHIGNVRSRYFECRICEESYRDLPSKVYLLKITLDTVIQSFTWLKLGYAKTVSTRIKRYGLSSDVVIERLKVMDFATGREAHRFEASLHTKYLRKRLPIKKMKEFHTRDGGNECYPLEIFDTLMKDLEAKEKRMKK